MRFSEGSVIQNDSGLAYIVIGHAGETPIAVRMVDVTNPLEWRLMKEGNDHTFAKLHPAFSWECSVCGHEQIAMDGMFIIRERPSRVVCEKCGHGFTAITPCGCPYSTRQE